MISNKLSPSQFGRSVSIQSCFPEMRSIDDPGYEYPEDNDISIGIELSCAHMSHDDGNCLHIADHGISSASSNAKPRIPLSYSLPPEGSDPGLAVSDIQNSNSQLHRAISNSTIVPEALGCDAHMVTDQSFRQVYRVHPLTSQIPNIDARLTTQAAADNSARFPLSTVPYSDASAGDTKSNGLKKYVNLYLAALKGDWETAKEFLNSDQQAICARITRTLETALHIAAGARHIRFVEELVNLMTPDDLAIQNKVGNTALCFAAASGITEIAELMVNKNKNLPSIRGSKGATPLYMATLLGHKDMVWYLFSVTEGDDLTKEDLVGLLIAAITSNLFDVALNIIRCYPELATAQDRNGETALHVLARKPSAFYSGSKLGIWWKCIYSCLHVELPSNSLLFSQGQLAQSISHVPPTWKVRLLKDPKFLVPGFKAIYEQKLMHIQALELVKHLWEQILLLDDSKIGELIRSPSRLLFTAAEFGIVEFITVLIRSYPDLLWKVNNQSQSIFHIAVAHRQEEIFNLIHEIGAHKDLIAAYKDENNNNMLHLAGKLAPPNRLNIDSGAALQLRRELQWFKEVEKIIQPLYTEMKDSKGRTPQILFTEEHKGLVREGEKWMKDTASSCMVVATLIATVMFAAAFTVPGGNNNETGRAIFLTKRSFLVFSVSDALALFSSASSILIFLSILTSRYAEEDFLESLPSRLIIGLATLFISIATMMIAFCATLFLVLDHEFAWVAIPMALVACIPVNLFALLQFPLLVDMISHIYRSSFIFLPNNHLLY